MTWLSPAELYRLTGKRRHGAQRRVLDERHIRYTLGGKSGREPLVSPDDLDGKAGREQRPHRWDRIGSIRRL